MGKLVYIDCTFTYQSGLNTGIQRVVRNIVVRSDLAKKEFDFDFQPVVCILDRYYKIPKEKITNIQPTFAEVGRKGKGWLANFRAQAVRLFGSRNVVLNSLNAFEWGLRKAFALSKFLRLAWLGLKYRKSRVLFEKDDTFVLLDAFWTYDVPRALVNANKNKCNVVSVIYDLIPITHPQFVEEVNCQRYAQALPRLFPVVDQFVCISNSVAEDLRQYSISHGFKGAKIDSFRLGCDFVKVDLSAGVSSENVSGDVRQAFKSNKAWLVVGTIEPRKNHSFVLDAFEEKWRQGHLDTLIIVGRIGWMCEEIVHRVNTHPELNKKLFLLSHVSDADLQYCYKNTQGLIFASFTEGFGLPLVEAMVMGVPVLCSDIPVFKEIGGEYPHYFALKDVNSLVNLLNAKISVGKVGRSWPNWDGTLRELSHFFEN